MGSMSVGAAVELVAAALAVGLVLRLLWWCALTEPERRAVRLRRRVRREWVPLAHNLGLCHQDRAPALAHGGGARVIRVPRIRVEWDPYGVVGAVPTVPGVGLDEYRKHARFIADAWGCHAVRVTRLCPGVVQLRGLLVDPLGEAYELRPDGAAADVGRLHIGRDEWGEEVTISLTEVSGITVGGLPGYGKTSLVGHWFAQLAPSPAVQFAVLDGKGGADYAGLGDRCFLRVDDDMEQAREALRSLYDLLRARQGAIRAVRGTANAWREGPSEDWPLVVVVVDESHTYVQTGRRQFKEAAEENAWHLEQLVKKGRSVAMLTVLITQKQTGDAIPTAVRDVCQFSLSYACKTDDAAVAALGADIRNHAEVSPVRLVGREHVGVAVASLPGRPGFTRIRTPYVAEEHVAEVARRTADLRRDPSALLDGCMAAASTLCVLTVGGDEGSR
jgi:DNA segregation ATPase FtsK/SpoIIIE, S-DNA-T family